MTEVRTSEGVPEGWTKILRQRTGGNTAGTFDIYMISPEGTRFRSRKTLQDHLERVGETTLSIDDFDYSRPKADRQSLGEPTASPSAKVKVPNEKPTRKRKGPRSKTMVGYDEEEEAGTVVLDDSTEEDQNPLETSGEPVEKPTPREDKSKAIDVSKEPSILESYTDDDWKFVVATFFIEDNNYVETVNVHKAVKEFFAYFPTAKQLYKDGWIAAIDVVNTFGFGEDFVRKLTRYTYDFVVNSGLDKGDGEAIEGEKKAHQLWGVTPYVACVYRIMVLEDMWTPTTPGDGLMVLKKKVHKRLKAEKKLAAGGDE